MTGVRIFETVADISNHCLDRVMAAGRPGSVAVSFGGTYSEIFSLWRDRLLSSREEGQPHSSPLPSFFPADERLVPPEHEDSNWGGFRRLFLNDCGSGADSRRHAAGLKEFKEILDDYFHGPPRFDLIFLGLGADGHTASLFPGGCPGAEDSCWHEPVLATDSPLPPHGRLSLGPETIASAGELIMTVTGSGKSGILLKLVEQLKSAEPQNDELPPARIIRRRTALKKDTVILIDRAAADGAGGSITEGVIA